MNKPNPPPGSQPTSAVRAQTMPLRRLVNPCDPRAAAHAAAGPSGGHAPDHRVPGRPQVRAALRRPGRLHPPQRDPAGRHAVWRGARPVHRRTGAHPPRRQAGDPPTSRSWPTRPASRSTSHRWPRITTSSPGSTRPASASAATPGDLQLAWAAGARVALLTPRDHRGCPLIGSPTQHQLRGRRHRGGHHARTAPQCPAMRAQRREQPVPESRAGKAVRGRAGIAMRHLRASIGSSATGFCLAVGGRQTELVPAGARYRAAPAT